MIERLEADGHKTICVGRAVIIIEQCEAGDEYPKAIVLREELLSNGPTLRPVMSWPHVAGCPAVG